MSFFRQLGILGPKAGGTIAPSRFVKLDTTAGQVVQAGAGDPVIGVAQQGQKRAPGLPGSDTTIAAESGDAIDVYAQGDVCPVTAVGTITVGQWVKSDTNGKATPHTSGAAFVAGQALTGAAAGELVKVFLAPAYISL